MGCTPLRKEKKPIKPEEGVTNNIKASVFVVDNTNRFNEIYKLGKVIGSGVYGEVRTCFLKENGDRRAVKIIRKNLISGQSARLKIDNEKEILKRLDHPNIVRLYEFFEDHKKIYIVMEYCNGAELFSEVLKKEVYTENQAASIMHQLFSVLAYMHNMGFAHRNLKPENIYVDKEAVKIIDLEEACEIKAKMSGKVSAFHYAAPEMLLGNYSQACDLWSCGVILYILLCGKHPFKGRDDAATLENVKNYNFINNDTQWELFSLSAKDLISKLFKKEAERITALDALSHPWIVEYNQLNQPMTPIVNSALKNLKDFRVTSLLRDAIHTFITTQRISSKDTKILGEVFKKIDKNGDGKLSREELIDEYKITLGFIQAESEVERIMKEVDTDNNGYIDYTEFLKAAIDTRKLLSIENLRSAFRNFDKDFSGRISVKELKRVISEKNLLGHRTWSKILDEVDINGDGEIDLEEFEKLVITKLE